MAIENKILTFGGNKIGTVGGDTLMGFPPPIPIQLGAFGWYNATEIIKDVNNRVSSMIDLTANSNNLSQANSVNQPTWEAIGIGGIPTVFFDGTTNIQQLITTYPSDLTAFFDVYILGSMNTSANSAPRFFSGLLTNKRIELLYNSNSFLIVNGSSALDATVQTSVTLPFSPKLLNTSFNGANSRFYNNKIQIGGDYNLGSNHVISGFKLGCSFANILSHALVGRISEVIIFDRILTNNERILVNDYFFEKYGL